MNLSDVSVNIGTDCFGHLDFYDDESSECRQCPDETKCVNEISLKEESKMIVVNIEQVAELRAQGNSWAQIGSDLGVSPTTVRRRFQQHQQSAKETRQNRKGTKTEAEKEATEAKVSRTTMYSEYNESFPSFSLLPLVQSVAESVKNGTAEVGQRKTTVFLKHDSQRRQIFTLAREKTSARKEGERVLLMSPYLHKNDKGVFEDTLGIKTKNLKGLKDEQIVDWLVRVLKRAKLV